jgi:hypothetical protein
LVAPAMVERGTRVRTVATPLSFPVASASGRRAETFRASNARDTDTASGRKL